MRQTPSNQMTGLLLCSSVQHLRLTLEPMPVGQIVISSNGNIKSIDTSTERLLKYSARELLQKNFTLLLLNPAFDFIEAMRTQSIGYVQATALRTRNGEALPVELGLASGSEPHVFVIFFLIKG
jgi:PAS domain S-box-containing protein